MGGSDPEPSLLECPPMEPLRATRVPLLLAAAVLASSRPVAARSSEPGRMVRLEAGTFTMGSSTGEPDERPERRVSLAAFLIDRTEVTQAAYAACERGRACRPAARYPGAEGASLPAVGVSFRDAAAYCAFAGKRLPTEAEWERAARGTDGRTYPWGEDLACHRANFGNFMGAGPCSAVNPGRILPVGSRSVGSTPEGVLDLGGNVWEWVEDLYAPYPGSSTASRPAPRPGPPGKRVVRGGSCCSYFAMPRAANRLAFPPDYRDGDLGFRCARDAAPSPGAPTTPSPASAAPEEKPR
jgi:formylglycine-generating enzyme required for sulfatase activity